MPTADCARRQGDTATPVPSAISSLRRPSSIRHCAVTCVSVRYSEPGGLIKVTQPAAPLLFLTCKRYQTVDRIAAPQCRPERTSYGQLSHSQSGGACERRIGCGRRIQPSTMSILRHRTKAYSSRVSHRLIALKHLGRSLQYTPSLPAQRLASTHAFRDTIPLRPARRHFCPPLLEL